MRLVALLLLALLPLATPSSAQPTLAMDWGASGGKVLGIVVANPGPMTAEGLVVELPIPAGTRISSEAAGGAEGCGVLASVCAPGHVARWSLPLLEAGESARLQVRPSLPWGATTFDARVLCGDTLCASATEVALRREVSLALDLAVSHGPLVPGETATVLVSVANDRLYSAHDTVVRLSVPGGIEVETESAGALLDGNVRTWELGRLSRTEARRRALSFRVPEDMAPGSLLEFEAIANASFEHVPDQLERSSAVVRVVASRDVEVAGAPVVVLHDRDEAGAILDPRTAVGLRSDFVLRPLSLVNDLGGARDLELDAPGSAEWSISSGYRNPNERSALFPAGQRLLDGWVELGRWRWSTHFTRGAVHLLLAHSPDRAFVAAGEEASWKLVFSNTGFRSAGGTVLRFRVPEFATYESASDGGVLVGDTVEWHIGDVAPGDGGSRSVRLVVDPELPGGALLRGLAWIVDESAPQHEEWALGAVAVVPDGGNGAPEIELEADTVEPGSTVPVVVSARNGGPEAVSLSLWLDASRGVFLPHDTFSSEIVTTGEIATQTVPVEIAAEAQPGALAWLATSGLHNPLFVDRRTIALVRVQARPLEFPAAGGPAAERCQRDLLRAFGDLCRNELRCDAFLMRNGGGKPAARCYVRGIRRFDRRVARAAERASAVGASCSEHPRPFSATRRLSRGVSTRVRFTQSQIRLDAALLTLAGSHCKREARALVDRARGRPDGAILDARERFVKKFDRKLRGRRGRRYSGWPGSELVHLVAHTAESWAATIARPEGPHE